VFVVITLIIFGSIAKAIKFNKKMPVFLQIALFEKYDAPVWRVENEGYL
jgi:hypothetical protein